MTNFKPKKAPLRVPCCYQGGKQRVSPEIVNHIFETCDINESTHFYDLCCGSGAYTIELLNRGIKPENITMLDKSSWGVFWKSIGEGTFDLSVFQDMVREIPENKKEVKKYVSQLAREGVNDNECYVFLILQACSFGGKQIWNDGHGWRNAFFRDYWEPKSNSVRKSPANPMQPSPATLLSRVAALAAAAQGVRCVNEDVNWMLTQKIPANSIVYMDPPYKGTTGYAFGFDVDGFIDGFRTKYDGNFFVSEGQPISDNATQLAFRGAKGGISGIKVGKHQEWLSQIG